MSLDYEVTNLPERYRPLSAWAYFGYNILFSLPIVGLVLLIVFSLDDSNINRRNYARSFFCVLVLLCILFVIFFASGMLMYLADMVS